ncbi:methylamine utilization ferredoxin-type protein MauN [Calderihabitans maritimus]|uniref:Methylamine utilization ferredoxin-type protein MauN n=1 Tax=Calderihabitans maritimus TaxID=1246530 RepID=A0A1Z5HXP5_9FIRM|nr:methylamine utilization ferredoxin-type protein MauN [Calderihabitans maritimus]
MARKLVQLSILVLFLSPLFGLKVIRGTLGMSQVFGVFLADPLAVLEAALAAKTVYLPVIYAALLVLGFYFIVGGRAYCSWVCPVNLLLEGVAWVRERLKIGRDLVFQGNPRYKLLGGVLILSLLSGLPVYEIVSPVAVLMRDILFGWGTEILIVLAVVLLDLFISRRGWCRYLCPLGAFYSLIGRFSLLRVKFQPSKCTNCARCDEVCYVGPHLTRQLRSGGETLIASGDCSNCGACIDACKEGALSLGLRGSAGAVTSGQASRG